MDIILDTNIIVSDFFLKSANFRLLFEYSKKIPFEVYIPEIVLDEVLTKFHEMLEEKYILYKKSIAQLNPLLPSSHYNFLDFDLEVERENYEDFIKDKIKDGKLKLLPYPKTTHKDIVMHELSRKKPFKANGSGYRDKLVIDTIFEKFPVPEASVIFISNNSNDFGIEPEFEQDLFYKVKVSNQTRFRIKNKLSGFIEEYIQPIKQINNDIKTIPQLSKYTGIDISDWVLLNMGDIIYDNGIGYTIMGLEEGYGTILLHKIDFIKSISVSDVTEMDENITTCKIKIITDLILFLSGDQDDFLHSESWREFFDYNISEGWVDISTWHSISTDIVISIVIDNEKSEIISYDPISVDSELGSASFEW